MEYFHDHVRIEKLLFDGFIEPVDGMLRPDRSRPGHGLTFKHADAQTFALEEKLKIDPKIGGTRSD